MAWIKRNLFFVISMAAGLILTGYCVWLLMGHIDGNTAAQTDYQSGVEQLKEAQDRRPPATTENIDKAKAQKVEIDNFVVEARKAFAPFPPPPVETQDGFSAYLENTIADLTAQATNAGVGLPEKYSFAFTDLRGRLKFPPENIPLWMQQWQEIKAICDILFKAKINSIVSIERPLVNATNDPGTGADIMVLSATPNTGLAIITPYKITFKSFSGELAEVLSEFAKSSNCFVVKNVVVYPAGARQMDQNNTDPNAGAGTFTTPPPVMPPQRPGESREEIMRENSMYSRRLEMWRKEQLPGAVHPASAKGPNVTVEREQVLQITLAVEVVKMKAK